MAVCGVVPVAATVPVFPSIVHISGTVAGPLPLQQYKTAVQLSVGTGAGGYSTGFPSKAAVSVREQNDILIEENRSTHDAYENTCKCGELKLYFSHPPEGKKKKL